MSKRRILTSFESWSRSGGARRNRSIQAWLAGVALFAAMFTLQRLEAQVLYGSIVGTIADQAGATVPNAKVRITSRGTTQSRETLTDAAGTYTFPSLPGDTYDVVVSKEGFQSATIRETNVAAGNTVRVDAVLKVGAVEQSVEVSAQASVLQTENGEVRSAISTASLENIPSRSAATTRAC